MADNDPCGFAVVMNTALLLAELAPSAALVAGCEIRKQPDCCPECAMNHDCSRVPVHDNCHCEAEPFLIGG